MNQEKRTDGQSARPIEKFKFHGDDLDVVPGTVVHVVVRRFCDLLGVSYQGQIDKLKTDPSICLSFILTQAPGDDQGREVACVDLRSLPLWLATIHPSKVKPEVVEKLIAFKLECADVLADHFLGRRGASESAVFSPERFAAALAPVLVVAMREVVAPIVSELARITTRLDRIESASPAAAGIVTPRDAKTIKCELASIAMLRVVAGLAPNEKSARSALENQLRGAVGWAGTGCSWSRLPAHKMADVQRELDVLRREAHAAEMGALARRTEEAAAADLPPPEPNVAMSIEEYRAAEKLRILKALNEYGWNRKTAAEKLLIARRTLYRRMKEYQIQTGDTRSGVAAREKARDLPN